MKGLTFRRNKNSFFVIQVHYSADPHKDPATARGQEWYQKARRGMPEQSWKKEYEIDWFARSGQLVYPQFSRGIHLMDPFKIPTDWIRYCAVDPGLRNPTAALWAAVDEEGNVYFYDEHYVAEKEVQWHANIFKQKEKNTRIFRRLIDPSAANRSPSNKKSIIDEYKKHGIFCIPANNNVEAGINRVIEYLKVDPDTQKPRVFFFKTLQNTINEITNYRWEEIDPHRVILSNPPERPVKKNDHLMDCLRYILMDDPCPSVKMDIPGYRPRITWNGMTTGYI